MPNGPHRAEVMKLCVLRRARRKGVAKALMRAIEQETRPRGRQLLVLDTRAGDVAEKLYEEIGYTKAVLSHATREAPTEVSMPRCSCTGGGGRTRDEPPGTSMTLFTCALALGRFLPGNGRATSHG